MSKINIKIFILLIYFTFLINPALGNINITFVSDNEKIINIIDIDNGYNQISSNSTNQTINLSYNNYNIKLYPTNSRIINNNGSFIINNITSFNNDWQLVLWLAVIIGLIFVAYKIFNGNKL